MKAKKGAHALSDEGGSAGPRKTLGQAIWQIIVADFSMSLDNVLAVGGAAREHPWVLVFGLALSIALMAFAASWIARLLGQHRWVGFVGLAIIVYVALEMIWRGWGEVEPAALSSIAKLSDTALANGVQPAMLMIGGAAGLALLAVTVVGLTRKGRAT